MGIDGLGDIGHLGHHLLIYVQPAGSVDDDDIVVVLACVLYGIFCDLYGIFAFLGVNIDICLLTQNNQLLNSGGSLQVVSYQEGIFAFGDNVFSEFSGGGGFSATLEAGQHDYGGSGRDKIDTGVDRAHQFCKLIADDFNEDLAGMQALYHLGTDGGLGYIFAELLYDAVADVGFEKRLSHIPHSVGDVCLSDSSPACQRPEDCIEFFGQRFKHFRMLVTRFSILESAVAV